MIETMSARIMDGKLVASKVKEEVARRVARLKESGTNPWLSTVLVGDDPASATYLKAKHKACEEVGIKSENHQIQENTSQGELEDVIDQLNNDNEVNGILVQLPLPKHLNEQSVIARISPKKDVDGLHPDNLGKLASGEEGLVPCTPKGVIRLLDYYNVPVRGSRSVIINRSNLVGRPLGLLLLNRDATVTLCHSKTRNLPEVTREADILVSAIGRPNVRIGPEYVKKGATVIDVAINRVDGKLRGDVDYDSVSRIAGFITPVPGGVGPMTVAMLLENTVQATALQSEIDLE